MNPQVFWYLARASGLVAGVLLTVSVIWGLALSTRVARTPKPKWVLDMHRHLSAGAVLYTGLHLAALWADSYVHFDAAALFVPMASRWRPGAVAWGIVGFYALAAIELTSLAKRRIPKPLWRAVHMSSFCLLVGIWLHAFSAGSDMGSPVARWLTFASAGVVVFLLTYRALSRLRLPESLAPAR